MAGITAVWVGLRALASCLGPTEIELEIATDLPCNQIMGTGIVIGPPDQIDTRAFTTTTTSCDGGVIGTFVVVPSNTSATVGIEVVAGSSRDVSTCDRTAPSGCTPTHIVLL